MNDCGNLREERRCRQREHAIHIRTVADWPTLPTAEDCPVHVWDSRAACTHPTRGGGGGKIDEATIIEVFRTASCHKDRESEEHIEKHYIEERQIE